MASSPVGSAQHSAIVWLRQVQQVVLQFGFEKKFVCKKICLRTLATATAAALGPVPPPPFALAAKCCTATVILVYQSMARAAAARLAGKRAPGGCMPGTFCLQLARYATIDLGTLANAILKRAINMKIQNTLT